MAKSPRAWGKLVSCGRVGEGGRQVPSRVGKAKPRFWDGQVLSCGADRRSVVGQPAASVLPQLNEQLSGLGGAIRLDEEMIVAGAGNRVRDNGTR